MARGPNTAETFTEFVLENEAGLRHALSAAVGSQLGKEAAAEALAYGWEHWERVGAMENPAGYLYKVGRDKGRRMLRGSNPQLTPTSFGRIPDVEPRLPKALAELSERQRVSVMLIHCFEWTYSEVADFFGVTKASVQTHVDRGMTSLRREIGVDNG